MSGDWILEIEKNILGAVPENYINLILLIFFTVVIICYSVFVYYFYTFVSKKNFIELNLNQYKTSEHPVAEKIFGFLFYILEYVIILPVLTFFWFGILSILLFVLVRSLSAGTILLISAALVASVRVTSYLSQKLSQDLAKMLPLTLLGLSIIDSGFFDLSMFVTRISEIPSLLTHIPIYLIFIIILELIMRIGNSISDAFSPGQKEIKNK